MTGSGMTPCFHTIHPLDPRHFPLWARRSGIALPDGVEISARYCFASLEAIRTYFAKDNLQLEVHEENVTVNGQPVVLWPELPEDVVIAKTFVGEDVYGAVYSRAPDRWETIMELERLESRA